jgi:hypothetical protein
MPSKKQKLKNHNQLAAALFVLSSFIYLANGIYVQYFISNPDTNQFVINTILAIAFFCIGLSFWKK